MTLRCTCCLNDRSARAPRNLQRLALQQPALARRGPPCAMAPKVRKRPAAAILKSETGASYSMMARAGDERIWDATKEFDELVQRETPYGPILKHMDLQRHDGSYFRLGYACPFALFFLVCTETPHLLPMLVTHIGALAAAS